MASPKVHVVVDGPAGTSFASFPSSDLEQGDLSKITLAMVRNKSAVPNKYFFTADGKSKVDDKTTLAYYMSLSPEGQKILEPSKGGAGDQKADSGEKKADPVDKKADAPGIPTFKVKITNSATATAATPPGTNEALSKLLDSISKSPLERGKLPTFSDRSLAALTGNYAVNASTNTYLEPADLDGNQWNSVLSNTRALTGYYYKWMDKATTPVLVKARKPAFTLRGAAAVGEQPAENASVAQVKIPAIPPFYVDDDATVSVTEVRTQFQHTLVEEGFNSIAVGGSLSGGAASIPGSITASFEKEHSSIDSKASSSDVDSLIATYSFPRVVIELEPEHLILTEECRNDATSVVDAASKTRFLFKYGNVFATKFTLGGYLYSTRDITTKEQASLKQIKDRTRIAAGLSLQIPEIGGALNFAKVDSSATDTGAASLFQDARLTWNARGGDTILCSNPPAWASSVKDYKLWRVMNQQRLVTLEGLLKDVDVVAWRKIDTPSVTPPPTGDIVEDHEQARFVLFTALLSPESNAMVQAMRQYYQSNNFQQLTNLVKYNAWIRTTFPTDTALLIEKASTFEGLNMDQQVGIGLYMAYLKVLKVV